MAAGAAGGGGDRSVRPAAGLARAGTGAGVDDDGQLAAAVRHQLHRRHRRGDLRAGGRRGDAGGPRLSEDGHAGQRAPERRLSPDPAAARGGERGVPHRRPVQPLCLVRADADRELRADGVGGTQDPARRHGEVRLPQLPRDQFLPRLAGAALRHARNAEHGRRGGRRHARRSGGDGLDCGAAAAGLRGQGRRLSGERLAAGKLPRAAAGHFRAACRPSDQGRDLCADPDAGDAAALDPRRCSTRLSRRSRCPPCCWARSAPSPRPT